MNESFPASHIIKGAILIDSRSKANSLVELLTPGRVRVGDEMVYVVPVLVYSSPVLGLRANSDEAVVLPRHRDSRWRRVSNFNYAADGLCSLMEGAIHIQQSRSREVHFNTDFSLTVLEGDQLVLERNELVIRL